MPSLDFLTSTRDAGIPEVVSSFRVLRNSSSRESVRFAISRTCKRLKPSASQKTVSKLRAKKQIARYTSFPANCDPQLPAHRSFIYGQDLPCQHLENHTRMLEVHFYMCNFKIYTSHGGPHESIHANRFISQLLDCPGNTPKVST